MLAMRRYFQASHLIELILAEQKISDHLVCRVAIQRPIDKMLDYRVRPPVSVKAGCRVIVPLGKSQVVGLVVESGVKSHFPDLKPIRAVLDKEPVIKPALMRLLLWASRYYCYPPGEVLFHALPGTLRKGNALPMLEQWSTLSTANSVADELLKRAPKQRELFAFLLDREATSDQLKHQFGENFRAPLRQLLQKGLVTSRTIDPKFGLSQTGSTQSAKTGAVDFTTSSSHEIRLSEEQQQAVSRISAVCREQQPRPVLLHGVTGSGKTEVYLHVLQELLQTSVQVLVMVPEIGLTPQLTERFRRYFPRHSIALAHSALTDSERLQIWRATASGTLDIVIGTRSSVFLPFRKLGAIVVDEEHDMSFKQQEGFLYHARDLVIKRAYDAKIPVILGSATPSLESLLNTQKGRYHYIRLGNRPGNRKRPEMRLIDTRTLPLQAGISPPLMEQISAHLKRREQVLLYLNRRGFAPVWLCPDCGWHAVCKECERGMTYHAQEQKLVCHHCGAFQPVTTTCPACGSQRLTTQGQGTERIEQVLKAHFPETPVIRIDRDSTARKGTLEHKLKQVHSGEPAIIVGTQMLTKGHDFPALTLVGIVDVDQALFSMDYRAQERLTQQIIQVAGRAGRGERKGVVMLQTAQPDHPILQGLLSRGYLFCAQQILNERGRWHYPPYGAQALIRANSRNAQAAIDCLQQLNQLDSLASEKEVSLLGPVPSLIGKKSGRYRYQFLLSANRRSDLHDLLQQVLKMLQTGGKRGGVRWSVDVDPHEFA